MHRSCLTSALRRLSLLDPPRSLSTGSTVLSSSSHSTRSPALARPFTLEAPSDAPFRRRNSPRGFQPRPPSPSSSRATRRERPSPPPLPSATDPSVSLDTLDPAHFSHLRRSFLESIGRVPTRAELSNYLPRWLREQANLAERERRKVVRSEWMQDRKRERLDLAWMWEKRKVERLGIERSEHEKRKDERVMKRLEERMRQKRQRELEKELQERDQPWIDLDNKKLTQEEKEELGGGVPAWKKHRAALKEKFPEGWAPPKRISREAMDLLRALHQVDPTTNSVPALGLRFKISPEAVRRVLKSKFELSQAERDKREVKRKEERQRQIASAGGDGLASDPAREDHTWSGDRSRERDEMARLRQRNNESPSSDDRDKSP